MSAATIRPMLDGDVDEADRVMRLAFGTWLGVPDPMTVFGDSDILRARYRADPRGAFVAERDGEVVGAVYATRWGSYAFFGPLCVRPDSWDQGIGGRLLEPVMDLFAAWGVRQSALYTFPASTKHVGLYQRFGFWPQHLTSLLAKPPAAVRATAPETYDGDAATLEACRKLSDSIFEGLDLSAEIEAARAHGFGATVLVRSPRDGTLGGFAVCHDRAGEAPSDVCFVKFAVAADADAFEDLLDACEAFAAAGGAAVLVAGVNLARHDAYRRMLARGFRVTMQGVIMQSPNEPGYCRPDVYALDDLR
ncbi:MAG TPA: GNAT family N-acetyltransferase [Solirubrobacteraceae bacterium]